MEGFQNTPAPPMLDQDKITLQYMRKYKIDNVRGGSFCQYKLQKTCKETINRMINSSTDKCYKCGKIGHFINECQKNQAEKLTIFNEDSSESEEESDGGDRKVFSKNS